MAHRDVWPELALTGADVALLQEVPPPHALSSIEIIPGGEADWRTAGWEKCDWRTAIARLSEVVHLAPRPTVPLHGTTGNADFGVSREGTITAAEVIVEGHGLFTAVSVRSGAENRGALRTRSSS